MVSEMKQWIRHTAYRDTTPERSSRYIEYSPHRHLDDDASAIARISDGMDATRTAWWRLRMLCHLNVQCPTGRVVHS